MKYVKPEIEVINVKDNIFMAFSGNVQCFSYDPANPGHCEWYDGNGVHCGGYQQGSYCESISYDGFTCYGYNGHTGSINGVPNASTPACTRF